MRSLAIIALGSFVASISLTGQSLSEHAAAAAGATVGTAAGKPLGTALGKIFGDLDKSTSKAAGTKVVKPVVPKAEATTSAPALAPTPSTPLGASGGSVASGGSGDASRGGPVSARRSARRRELAAEPPVPIPAPITPLVVEPVVKEPSLEEVAAVQVGATANELEAALGAPESRVSIPDDDGHLLEICQYWAKGQPLGTVRLDNGHVVSVQTR
jgi:hypothetical protein